MNDNILKKYSAPVESIDLSPSSDRKLIINKNAIKTLNISYTAIIKNENYDLEVNYSNGKIVYIAGSTQEISFSSFNDPNFKEFYYTVPSNSNLTKKGVLEICVADYIIEPMDIKKFCSFRQRTSRFFKRDFSNAVNLNKSSLSDPETILWLEEHDLYEKFIDSQALLDSLSELLLGNQVTEKQLVNLMETGELFRSEEEKLAYFQRVRKLQREVSEFEKKLEASADLEKFLQSQLEKARQEKKATEIKKNSLYNNFIKDREME